MICRYSTFICVFFFKYIFCYITLYIVMYTLLCVFCMFSLVYEGSVGLIYIYKYIYENAYFMKFLCIHVYFLFLPSVNKVFIIIIILLLILCNIDT